MDRWVGGHTQILLPRARQEEPYRMDAHNSWAHRLGLDPTSASLSLQMIPVQPAGQSQPSRPGKQVPPFLQSSQVRLQSWPKVWSKQTGENRERDFRAKSPSLRPLGQRREKGQPPTFQGETWEPHPRNGGQFSPEPAVQTVRGGPSSGLPKS